MYEHVTTLRRWVAESDNIVFFGGAGVSTESGIPDFRSVDGLYNQHYRFPPETILSRSFFLRNPEEFYRFYHEKMCYPDAQPNRAHRRLAELEAQGKLRAVVTQNIDGLHQKAGSKKVLELHGSAARCYCLDCGRPYPGSRIDECTDPLPRCDCGGLLRPDVVLYEEGLDENVMAEAVRRIREAELLIVGGTSLAVYPAAGLIRYYRPPRGPAAAGDSQGGGNRLVLINRDPTPYDGAAALVIHEKIGEVFAEV